MPASSAKVSPELLERWLWTALSPGGPVVVSHCLAHSHTRVQIISYLAIEEC